MCLAGCNRRIQLESLVGSPVENGERARGAPLCKETAVKKWEYRIVDSRDVAGRGIFRVRARADVEAYLNRLGKEGWEIVNLDFPQLGLRFEFSGVAKRELAP